MRETLAFLTLALLACSSDDSTPEPSASIAFAGVRAVAPSDENTLRVSWAPADGSFRYRVYASIHAGRAADNPPVLTTEPGATSAYIKVGPPGSRQFVTVRVVDAAGHVDANRIEKSAVPASDTHAPTFAGLKNL